MCAYYKQSVDQNFTRLLHYEVDFNPNPLNSKDEIKNFTLSHISEWENGDRIALKQSDFVATAILTVDKVTDSYFKITTSSYYDDGTLIQFIYLGNRWEEYKLVTEEKLGVNDNNPSISTNGVTITTNKIINGVWYISGYSTRAISNEDVIIINNYKFNIDDIFYETDQKGNYFRCFSSKIQGANIQNDSCFGFSLPVVPK